MTRTLREQGLGDWVARFEQNAPVSHTPTALVLEIRDGGWDLYGQPRGGQREEIDYDAQFKVDGNTVVVSHEGDSNTYRWAVDSEALKLAWLDTTYGATRDPRAGLSEGALHDRGVPARRLSGRDGRPAPGRIKGLRLAVPRRSR